MAHDSFMKSLERENVTQIPSAPKFNPVARFEFFEKKPDRQYGVWLVRQGNLQFALPITTGTKPAVADYLPAPFGLRGFAAPVEEVYPSLVPFLELEDGKTYATSEGATLIEPASDGKSLRVIWKKWARTGSKSGETFENGITSEVRWRIEGNKLIRAETLTSDRDLIIKNWRVALPTTADRASSTMADNQRVDIFEGREGTLKVTTRADWQYETALQTTGDSRLGKGVLGAIPLHLVYSASNLQLAKNQSKTWQIVLELVK
jgi:hypothetical protein